MKLFRNVKVGDTIKIDGEKVKVQSRRVDPDGRINIRAEGKGLWIQESYDPDARAR